MTVRVQAAVRTYTEPEGWSGPPQQRERKWRWPEEEYVVVFDTETTTDQAQGPPIGAYLVAKISWHEGRPSLRVLEEGLIAGDRLEERRPAEHERLLAYARRRRPAVDPASLEPGAAEPGCPVLRIRSRQEFVQELLLPACLAGATVVTFNAGFDFSRIAEGWGKARKRFLRGFRLPLATYVQANGRRRASVWVRTKRVAPKRFLLELAALSPERGNDRR